MRSKFIVPVPEVFHRLMKRKSGSLPTELIPGTTNLPYYHEVEISPQHWRGGHLHLGQTEWDIVLRGSIRFILYGENGLTMETGCLSQGGSMLWIPSRIGHVLFNDGKFDALVGVFSIGEFIGSRKDRLSLLPKASHLEGFVRQSSRSVSQTPGHGRPRDAKQVSC